MVTAGPFLRWAGGKRQLLPVIRAGAPATFARFFEPFLGGGAVFFDLALPGRRCTLGDVNGQLLDAYRVLRDQPDELIAALGVLGAQITKDDYYRIRALEPQTALERAARFIYLNRTSFNGLWRENAAGRYNVPFGHLKNPTVCNEPLLRACSAALQGTTICHGSFDATVASASAGDFVYLDPPYIPLSPTASFASYSAGGFNRPDQERLAATIADLTCRGVQVMLSNSDTPLTRQIFSSLKLRSVAASRSISAAASSRTRVQEIIGVNYDLADMADGATFQTLTS